MPHFANPEWFLAALVIPPIVWLYIMRYRRGVSVITFTSTKFVARLARGGLKKTLRHFPFMFGMTALLLIVIALARPQSIHEGQNVYSEGIDIIIVLDISASMLAQDFSPNRVEAAKVVAANFIQNRKNDRIGIVLFAKQAFTQCPLTVDHRILLEFLDDVKIGLTDPDNTAIGQALGAAVGRLKDSDSKSKVIILLTDGENNYGLPPLTAAEAAKELRVRTYTIGVGTRGTAPYPGRDMFGRATTQQVQVSIDEELLTEIAQSTGGRYFRATSETKLREIFSEIDRMEKTRIEIRAFRRYAELFYPWAIAAVIIAGAGLLLSSIYLKGVA